MGTPGRERRPAIALPQTGGKTMRNLLALFAFLLLAFVGLGWFLDWYQVRRDPAAAGHQNVNIDINGTKIIADVHKGIQKIEEKKQALATESKDEDAAKPSSDSASPVKPAPNE